MTCDAMLGEKDEGYTVLAADLITILNVGYSRARRMFSCPNMALRRPDLVLALSSLHLRPRDCPFARRTTSRDPTQGLPWAAAAG